MPPRLPAPVFYGLIAGGLVLGAAAAAGGVWLHLEGGGEVRVAKVFAGLGRPLAVGIAAMMGATFGALAGVGLAVVLDRRIRCPRSVSREAESAEPSAPVARSAPRTPPRG